MLLSKSGSIQNAPRLNGARHLCVCGPDVLRLDHVRLRVYRLRLRENEHPPGTRYYGVAPGSQGGSEPAHFVKHFVRRMVGVVDPTDQSIPNRSGRPGDRLSHGPRPPKEANDLNTAAINLTLDVDVRFGSQAEGISSPYRCPLIV